MASLDRPDLTTDVIVIGGGPGGSTAATMMARKGLKVVVLEQDHFPREHIGESLLPASMPVLQELGVLQTIEREGFLKKWGATMVWGNEPTAWTWRFEETNKSNPHAYQVWRPRFDTILLENSRANGVDVREGHRVLEVLFENGKAVGVRYQPENSTEKVARASFVVDASGQNALLGRKFDLRKWDSWFQNLAVYAYFEGSRRLSPPNENGIFIEAYPHGWFWNIPLHTGWMSVGAVVDKTVGAEGIRTKGPLAFLMEQLAEAPHSAKMHTNAKLVHGPIVLRDWSYVSDEVVGNGYILVGDAACFIDPLFSSGVHLALMGGVLAAAYVVSALKDPSMQEAAARVYKELYYQEYQHFRQMAKLFYSSNRTTESYFWEARRILDSEPELSPRHAFIRLVAGQPARGYERVVLEHGEAPAQFLEGVRAVQQEQVQRRERLALLRRHPDITRNPLYRAVPCLAEGVQLQRKPVVAEGEFAWGDVLVTAGHPEGTPASALVAKLVSLIDGKTPFNEIAAKMQMKRDPLQDAQIELMALGALHVLYVDGTVAEIKGIEPG
ncbi:MAG: NAD(P)/FAD-dependent oxidoreductase [Dehalococcoidia bacterium]|nr:NAD(P)/FAD-dependent oxidoreductase [Dehalococcoidia bacterium]